MSDEQEQSEATAAQNFDAEGLAADDAGSVEPTASTETERLNDRIDRLEERLVCYGVALARILTHLDPSHTSHSLDMKDLI